MFDCPICDFECPYCNEDGVCWLEDPAMNCDDYYAAMGDDEDEEV